MSRYHIGSGFENSISLTVSDATGDGLTDILTIMDDDKVMAQVHSGVFWPQDSAATFLGPVVVAAGWDTFDIIG